MKNTVIYDEYREVDLKPKDLLKKYVQLTESDVQSHFLKSNKLDSCPCPACQSVQDNVFFMKFGMSYRECNHCRSIFVSPRPDDKLIHQFYQTAVSRIYWRDEFSKLTGQKRKEKIIRPRFQWIVNSLQEFLPGAQCFGDVHTSQYDYIDALLKENVFQEKYLIDPLLPMPPGKADSGLHVVSTPWWETKMDGRFDVLSLFEVLDHTSDVNLLFNAVSRMLKKDGLCFMTAILSTGFDVQMLGDKAENLYPPDRLNVFSVEGLESLFQRYNFECLEFSTPGILDVEILEKALKNDPSIPMPKFVRYLLSQRDGNIKKVFQEFLQSARLSSYGRILLRRK